MSDTPQGPGWWMASDGKFYAPELHPAAQSPVPLDPRAGSSAQAKADKLRADAEKWERGAEGERMTAAALAALPAGWVAVHDLHVPGSRANADHVVVGPNGVWVVDSKAYTGEYRHGSDTLWRGRYPIRRECRTLDFITGSVSSFLEVPAWSCMCFTHATLPSPVVDLPTVRVCSVGMLPAVLTSGPARYSPDQVEMIAARARTLVVPRRAAAEPAAPIPTGAAVDPEAPRRPRPAPTTPAARARPSSPAPRKAPSAPAGRKRPQGQRQRQKGPTPGGVVLQAVVVIVALVVVMKVVAGMADDPPSVPAVPTSVVTTACPVQPC